MNQLRLLGERRFGPLLWAVVLGAFNDNLVRAAVVATVVVRSLPLCGLAPELLAPLAAALFVVPFLLLSPLAGQLSDRLPKASLVRALKLGEVAPALLAGAGLWLDDLALALAGLLLLGVRAALLGPVKYAILPELLDERDLVGGNALLQTGTVVAILLGTLAGGALGSGQPDRLAWAGAAVAAAALLGLAASRSIPGTAAASPGLPLSANPAAAFADVVRATAAGRTALLSVLGLSWFWALGAAVVSLLPLAGRQGPEAGATVVAPSLLCLGLAAGSLLCERLSRRRLELGLVPLGSLGVSLFALDLAFALPALSAVPGPAGGSPRPLRPG